MYFRFMYKPEQYIKVKGKLIQLGYEKYTQDADFHNNDDIIALNNKFPNLVGYGFIMYLKELMAMNPACKILWDDDMMQKMASMMNMEVSVIRSITNYCIKELKMLRKVHTWRELERTNEYYLIYPDFMEELINLQSKRLYEESEIRKNANLKEDGIKFQRGIDKKNKMKADMREILIFTDEIKGKGKMYYPDVDVRGLWDEFVDMCETYYFKWHAILTPDNYATTFFTYLNKHTSKIVIPKE